MPFSTVSIEPRYIPVLFPQIQHHDFEPGFTNISVELCSYTAFFFAACFTWVPALAVAPIPLKVYLLSNKRQAGSYEANLYGSLTTTQTH